MSTFFLMLIYFWERECEWGRGRESGRHGIQSRLQALNCQNTAQCRTQTMNGETMTWAKVSCLTDWTTQAPYMSTPNLMCIYPLEIGLKPNYCKKCSQIHHVSSTEGQCNNRIWALRQLLFFSPSKIKSLIEQQTKIIIKKYINNNKHISYAIESLGTLGLIKWWLIQQDSPRIWLLSVIYWEYSISLK